MVAQSDAALAIPQTAHAQAGAEIGYGDIRPAIRIVRRDAIGLQVDAQPAEEIVKQPELPLDFSGGLGRIDIRQLQGAELAAEPALLREVDAFHGRRQIQPIDLE